jgi:hypothetical protein
MRERFTVKTQSLRRVASGTAAAAIVLAGAALVAAPAGAVTVGTLSFSPAIGNASSLTAYQTSGVCSNAGDNIKVTVIGGSGTGAVLTLAKNIVGAQSPTPSGAGISVAAFQSWTDFATTNSLTVLNGTYTVSAVCTVSGDHYDGQVTFTGVDKTSATYASVRNTLTSLSPASQSIPFGSAAIVTANVSSDQVPTGAVQFKVDGTNSGSAVAVDASGNAVFNIPTSLASGSHTITAAFTPDAAGVAAGFQASSNTAGVSVTVTKTTASVSLSDSTSGSAAAGTATTLNATINPASLAGTVTFSDGASVLGSAPVNTSTGVASFVWNISPGASVGAHTLSATFAPTDTVNVNTPVAPATSAFSIGAATGINVSGNVTVTLPTGTLSITTPAAMTLTFGSKYLSSNGKYFIATGGVQPVTVSDTRAGDFGWTLKTQSTDFVGTQGGNAFVAPVKYPWQKNVINAANLGFTQTFVDAPVGETLNTGIAKFLAANTANGLLPSDNPLLPGISGTTGLGAARSIVLGQGGGDIGSATGNAIFSGYFQLNIPTVTIADTYVSTLTYTLSSN